MEDGQRVLDPILQGGRQGEDVWGLFAVYDGHGGRQEVEYCESKLHEVVLGELRGQPAGSRDASSALVESFRRVDGQLAMLGAWNSGCTATVALAHRQGSSLTLHIANVGDSRAVLVSPTSTRRVSVDHRASDPSEARRVVEDGGVVRHGRVGGQLSVSRSLGDHHLKGCGVSCVPDVITAKIDPCEAGGHALVIASDGLWDAFEDDDAGQVVRECVTKTVAKGGGPEAIGATLRDTAALTLVEMAKERGSRDNILALVVFF